LRLASAMARLNRRASPGRHPARPGQDGLQAKAGRQQPVVKLLRAEHLEAQHRALLGGPAVDVGFLRGQANPPDPLTLPQVGLGDLEQTGGFAGCGGAHNQVHSLTIAALLASREASSLAPPPESVLFGISSRAPPQPPRAPVEPGSGLLFNSPESPAPQHHLHQEALGARPARHRQTGGTGSRRWPDSARAQPGRWAGPGRRLPPIPA
jgi:hypothetical protein